MSRAFVKRLLGYESLSQYAVVGLGHPQTQVRVALEGSGAVERDVTGCNVVVSLRPFLVGVSLPVEIAPSLQAIGRQDLVFRQDGPPDRGRELGRMALHPSRLIPLGERQLCVFQIGRHRDRCLDPARLSTYYARQWWQSHARRKPGDFKMTFPDLMRIWTFYACPRPVVLVTVQHGDASNIFPMDLIGPTESPYFCLALRNTSPSVKVIAESEHVALSRVPLGMTQVVYQLGKHHRLASIDWSALPFETVSSPAFGLPVPAAALGTRELEIHQVHSVGSHTLFLGRTVSLRDAGDGQGMFHISGLYDAYLKRHGVTLPRAQD